MEFIFSHLEKPRMHTLSLYGSVPVERSTHCVISHLLACSRDTKQLQRLMEMERQEEQHLLNVAQGKYQSYRRKDVIGEYPILATWFISFCTLWCATGWAWGNGDTAARIASAGSRWGLLVIFMACIERALGSHWAAV
jgi:hypothetical protein